MGAKYEVLYWDYKNGKYVTVEHTNSFIKAMWLVCKFEKKYPCVSIIFRRDKVKEV